MRELGDTSDEQATLDQVRINVAFEQMVVAVLMGAFVGGALTLLLNVMQGLTDGLSFVGFVSSLLQALFVSILIFLSGFGASVIFGAPFFAALEKRKQRNVWPYLGAGLSVAIAAFVVLSVAFPSAGGFTFKTIAAIFVPPVIVAGVFAKGMQPHWRAAEKAESEQNGPIVFRIH